jgi:hypothetical protein
MDQPSRDLLAARQRAWMQQRQAELDRKKAEQSLGLTSGTASAATSRGSNGGAVANQAEIDASKSAANNCAVLDRITEQITERLLVQVRHENARIMQDGAVGAQVEALLERHIGTNTCPICYELMAGKERQPTLLFPCGHTFCASCLRQHLEKLQRKTCPFCRETVSSQAPNVSLQQIIDGFVERQQVLARGEVLPELIQGQEAVAQQHQHQPPPQPPNQHAHAHATQRLLLPPGLLPSEEEVAQRYAEQYRVFSMRSRVMANQLHDSRAEAAALRKQRQTAETVLAHLHREEADAAARLEAARLELEVIRTQLAEQADKCAQVDMQQAELEQMATLVEQTQSSIELEKQKALLLVHNFAPVLAEELRREFAE